MSSPIYKPVSQNLPANNKVQTSSRANVQRVDTRCGFWMCKPACMQPLATIGVFTGVYSLANMLTQTLTFYVNSQVTTLERQFGFSSHQTGIIMAANDVGFLVCVLFAAHMASRTHIPRSLGVTTIVFGISGIACSLPHFLFGATINNDPTTAGINSTTTNFSKQSAVTGSLCDLFNNSRDPCAIAAAQTDFDGTAKSTPEKVAEISLVIIVIGMALQGFGKAPRMTYSVMYVDDNTAKVNTGFYTGIMIAAFILGPVSAFLLGGVFSRMYVTLEATQLTPRHPRWIGAWWLGFVVFGFLSLVVAIPLFCFPRKLPQCKAKDTRVDDETTTGNAGVGKLSGPHKKQSAEDKIMACHTEPRTRRFGWKSLLKHVREFLASLYRLFINPVYVCLVVGSCFLILMGAGNISFYPKYLERIFQLGIHTANYITAGMLFCTSFFGALIGGVLTRRYKMSVMACLLFTIAMTFLSAVTHLAALIFQCEQPRVHNWPSEENSCNSGCGCRDNSYFPVCGGDGRTYYSPCHAGCLQAEQRIYQNCSCIDGGQATAGTCDYACSHLYGYVISDGLRLLFTTLAVIPKLIVYMRCVPEKDKSMALSVLPFMTSLFGWMLSPIFFGNIIDNACLIWDMKCLTRGRCLLYDNNLFRVNFIGYGGMFLVCAFVFLLVGYVYARKTKCLDAAVTDEIVEDRAEMKPVVLHGGTVNT